MTRRISIWNALALSAAGMLLLSSPTFAAKSEEEQAVELYLQGEKLYRDGAYEAAFREFGNAIAVRARDGVVTVTEPGTTKMVKRQVVKVPGKSVDHEYYPNRGKGLCLLAVKKYAEAERFLQTSLDSAWTREAQDALKTARAALAPPPPPPLAAQQAKPQPPPAPAQAPVKKEPEKPAPSPAKTPPPTPSPKPSAPPVPELAPAKAELPPPAPAPEPVPPPPPQEAPEPVIPFEGLHLVYPDMSDARFAEAVAAYRAAAEAGRDYESRRAVFYEGKIYMPETYRSRKFAGTLAAETLYLVAMDPSTKKIVERHYLPGSVLSFPVREGILHVACDAGDGNKHEMRLAGGKLDRPVFPKPDANARLRSMRAGWALAANFLNEEILEQKPGARFAVHTNSPDAPQTFAALEAACRDAVERDPTQPWHLFFLGQALWHKDKKQEAEAAWTSLLTGDFSSVPYYEFAWMTYFCESLAQREWADKFYAETLARRKALPSPVMFHDAKESYNFPVLRLAAHLSRSGENPERQRLWLARAREILGVHVIEDDFAAAGWTRHFRKSGNAEKAKEEAAYFRTARNHPFNLEKYAARFALLFHALAPAFFGFWFLIFSMLGAAEAKWYATLADEALKRDVRIKRRLWRSCFAFFGIGMLLMATPWSDSAAGGSMMLGTLVFWCAAAFSLVFHARRPCVVAEKIAYVPKGARRTLGAAALFAVMFFVAVNGLYVSFSGFFEYSPPPDALGHPAAVRKLDEFAESRGTPAARYAAAVANHMAGNAERAKELYKSLPGDARAGKNLAALEKGELSPSESLTAKDLANAVKPTRKEVWRYLTSMGALAAPPLVVGVLIPCVVMFLLFWRIPFSREEKMPPLESGFMGRAARAAYFLVPGLYDMRRGEAWRGYVAFALFAFAAAALLFFDYATGAYGGPVISWSASLNLPFPPDVSARATLFWTLPYIKFFLAAVTVSLAGSLALHVSRLREIKSL